MISMVCFNACIFRSNFSGWNQSIKTAIGHLHIISDYLPFWPIDICQMVLLVFAGELLHVDPGGQQILNHTKILQSLQLGY